MIGRWAMVGVLWAGCVPDEGACVWTGGACYETSEASCAEDDAIQGGSTFHEGDTCVSLGCEPRSKGDAWHDCETAVDPEAA